MKYKYKLQNLDCANCARRIEEHLQKDNKLNNVVVNFSKLTLSFTSNEDNLKNYVIKKIKEVEPEVTLLEEDNEVKESITFDILKLLLAIIITIIAILIKIPSIKTILFIIAYFILLYEIAIKALKLLIKSFTIDENLLITISCIGAYLTDNIVEGLMVVILYNIGEILEDIAVNHSRKSIASLMDIKPEYANLKTKDEIIKTSPNNIKTNDIIIVKKGERIPLDGLIIKGHTKLNTVALTGETKLREVTINDEVLSGCINTEDLIEIKVTKNYENSTVSRILDLVENATDRKAKTENFVSKMAKIYTPIVILLALLVALTFPYLLHITYNESIYRALSFLVISCPCAIVISVPLSYFTGIGASSKEGILIKGSDYLDSLKDVNKIIFDKTGTLTTGNINSFTLEILNNKYSKEEIINYYLQGETYSNHPLAKSIINYFNKKINSKDVKDFKEITGKGISYTINNQKVLIGSSSFVKSSSIDNSIYLKIDNEIIAYLKRVDTLKPHIKETLTTLNDMNIDTLIFTGDSKEESIALASKLNITKTEYELLPEDKYRLLEKELKNNHGKVAFVGDGINDAPSLARSDIGISMGNIGSASAIEASDIVIINDDISKIITAIKISKKTNRIIKENLIFAILIKILVLILASLGLSSMWHAVFADTGVTLLTIINTTRILKNKKLG